MQTESDITITELDELNQRAWKQSRVETNDALSLALEALEKSTLQNYLRGQAEARRTIAQCHWLFGNLPATLLHLEESMRLFQMVEQPRGQAEVLNLYGSVYARLGDFEKAREQFKHALKIRRDIGDREGEVKSMNSIGDSLMSEERYHEALKLFQQALEIPHENTIFRGIVLYNVSEVYFHLDQLESADTFLQKCEKIGENLDFKLMAVYVGWLRGRITLKRKDYEKSVEQLTEALNVARAITAEDCVYRILHDLSVAFEELGDLEWAYATYKEFHECKERVLNETTTQKLRTLEHRLEMESLQRENDLVLSKNQELERAYREIEDNRNEIATQNKQITDSIRYAKRIQEAIMPPESLIRTLFPESFVIYQPKDVLSGDFYWVSEVNTRHNQNFYLAAVADCTGHGVPGALMSIVGNNFLRLCENEPTVNSPSDALEFINRGVSRTLRQEVSESSIQDGMDIGFVAVDYPNMMLYYAGARRDLYHVRDGNLTIIRGDRHPIGAFVEEELQPFTNQKMAIQKGDCLYLFSDGYIDQFGGQDERKFGYQPFKEMVSDNSHLPMAAQKNLLENAMCEWKGDLEQLDDICVFGLRV